MGEDPLATDFGGSMDIPLKKIEYMRFHPEIRLVC